MQKVLWQSRHTWRSRATVCCLKGEPIYSDGSSLTLSELGSFAVKSVAMFVLRLAGFLSFLLQAAAYPTSMACDFACMGGYTPGSTFGYMGVANIGATSGDTCKIATDVPSGGYTPGTSYMVTVTSTTALAQKLVSNGGSFSNGMVSDGLSKVTSEQHAWTAPGSGDVTFRALCGAGGSIDEVWYAAEVMVSEATTILQLNAVRAYSALCGQFPAVALSKLGLPDSETCTRQQTG